MLQSATLLAFYGFLRPSEYLSGISTSFQCEDTLLLSDISISPDFFHLIVHIKKSKTDPFSTGCSIKIWALKTDLCPVKTLLRFIAVHPCPEGPLFTFQDGTFLTRICFSKIIQQCFPFQNLNTHSFRIGAATSASAAGVPDFIIQVLGRWSSNCYRSYISNQL